MKLTSVNVNKLFKKCLKSLTIRKHLTEAESQNNSEFSDYIFVEGLKHDALFYKQAILDNKDNILSMIKKLPAEIREENGKCLFVEMFQTKHNESWIDNPDTAEKLLLLGIAIKKMVIVHRSKLNYCNYSTDMVGIKKEQ